VFVNDYKGKHLTRNGKFLTTIDFEELQAILRIVFPQLRKPHSRKLQMEIHILSY